MAPVVEKTKKIEKKTKSQRLNERAMCGRFSNRIRISSSYVGDKNISRFKQRMITKHKLCSCFVAMKSTVSIEAAEARLSHNALPLQPFQLSLSDNLDVTINSSTSDKSMQSLHSMDISEESRMKISFNESLPSFNQPDRPNEPVPSVPWVPLLRDDSFHPFLTIQRFLSIALNTIQRFVISTLSNESQ